jgi:hypothetical protein
MRGPHNQLSHIGILRVANSSGTDFSLCGFGLDLGELNRNQNRTG